jgi:hypothetical protein
LPTLRTNSESESRTVVEPQQDEHASLAAGRERGRQHRPGADLARQSRQHVVARHVQAIGDDVLAEQQLDRLAVVEQLDRAIGMTRC